MVARGSPKCCGRSRKRGRKEKGKWRDGPRNFPGESVPWGKEKGGRGRFAMRRKCYGWAPTKWRRNMTGSTVDLAEHPSFPVRASRGSFCAGHLPKKVKPFWKLSDMRGGRWRRAASTTRWGTDFTATRWMQAGRCRISKKCFMTMPNSWGCTPNWGRRPGRLGRGRWWRGLTDICSGT